MAQRGPTPRQVSESELLTGFTQGLQTYLDPTLTKYQQWSLGVNVYSGAFGYVQRARWANVVVSAAGSNATISTVTFPNGPAGHLPTLLRFTTTTAHGFSVNQIVTINFVSPAIFNGTYMIQATTSTTFDVLSFISGLAYQTAGTGTGGTATGYNNGQYAFTNNTFSLKFFSFPSGSNYLLTDVGNQLFSFDSALSYAPTIRTNVNVDPLNLGISSALAGPWSREILSNIAYEMNGSTKQTGRNANAVTIESFGLDAPDTSPGLTLNTGLTGALLTIQRTGNVVTATTNTNFPGFTGFAVNVTGVTDTSFNGTFIATSASGVSPTTITWSQIGNNTGTFINSGSIGSGITKSIGRSYAWAWENANKAHIGAPSPVTQYFLYANQTGLIQCLEAGTVTVSGFTVTGTNTAFTSAWIGRRLWVNSNGDCGRITSVTSATSMRIEQSISGAVAGQVFLVYDPSATHIRLYATADGGATYFRIARNAWNPTIASLASGMQFLDTANSEPPSIPFTTETSQVYNIPPPIGAFIKEYQGSLIVYGVTGAEQTFFYSNSTLTTAGLQQESYAPLNQVTLPIQNASINGMAECPGSLIIWSDKQDMFRLTGLLTDNTSATASQQGSTITALPYNLGCASPFAVALTPLGVVWLTSNAEVWLYTDRYAPRNIGRSIASLLRTINPSFLSLARMTYYHTAIRDWVVLSVPLNGSNRNTDIFILDLEQLASNGSPSYFVFDMATNQPSWYRYTPLSPSFMPLETMYENNGNVRLLMGQASGSPGNPLIIDEDFLKQGTTFPFGTETTVLGGNVTLQPWGNDSPQMIKRPTWFRFGTNRPPSQLASDGWAFQCNGIDDDFYTFASPLILVMTPGVNDASTLGGNPALLAGSPFRHSPELFKVGGVNFVMGRRLQFSVNFPTTAGADYQFRQIQVGFGPTPPR